MYINTTNATKENLVESKKETKCKRIGLVLPKIGIGTLVAFFRP